MPSSVSHRTVCAPVRGEVGKLVAIQAAGDIEFIICKRKIHNQVLAHSSTIACMNADAAGLYFKYPKLHSGHS